jgi:hypothetical protein
MARPIKETPVLYGEDARRFAERMQHPRPISAEKRKRLDETWEILKQIATFPL